MTQTILMAAAAVHLVVIACFITAGKVFHIVVFQVLPVLLAFGLGAFALARYMGWPL